MKYYKSEKDKYHMISHIVESDRNRLTDFVNNHMVTKGERRGKAKFRCLGLTDTHYFT